jgi:hypothetical protein
MRDEEGTLCDMFLIGGKGRERQRAKRKGLSLRSGRDRAAEHGKKDGADRKNDRKCYKNEVITFGAVIDPAGVNGRKKVAVP